jgi:putative transposase
MSHRRPPRLRDSLYTGPARVFVTMCTFERRTYFSDDARVRLVRDELLRTVGAYVVELIAYCFMHDHLHGLLEGCSPDSNVRKCAVMFRQRSGYVYRQKYGVRLWQDGFYDHVLRAEEATVDVVRYILANPLRAGLCSALSEYPYIGSSRYSFEEMGDSVQWRPDRTLA